MARRSQQLDADAIARIAPQQPRQTRVAQPAKPPVPSVQQPRATGRKSNAQKEREKLQQERAAMDARQRELDEREAALNDEPAPEAQPEQFAATAAPSRSAPRPVRSAPREPTREPARGLGGVMIEGHNGEMLTRRRSVAGDIYHIEPHEIPNGWTYQWNTHTVGGQEQMQMQLQMHANGWRPVPASRHPNRWTQPGHEGHIIVNGLRLEERPEQLTAEAKAEDTEHARELMRTQTDVLRMGNKLPSGMADRGGKVSIRQGPGHDAPRPTLQIDDNT